MDGPRAIPINSERRIEGNDMNMSITRPRAKSNGPLKYPPIRPSRQPRTSPSATAASDTVREILAP